MAKPSLGYHVKAVASGRTPMLSDWWSSSVGYECRRCSRRGVFDKASLLETQGDMPLTMLLKVLTANCPRHGRTHVYELCGAVFILPEGSTQS